MKTIATIRIERNYDDDPDTSYLEQKEFEDRLDQFRRGVFNFISIRVVAEIVVDNLVQTIMSSGIYGIEDDSDEIYLKTIESDEITSLCNQLSALGFGPRAITKALDERN